MKQIVIALSLIFGLSAANAQGYKVGDKAASFSLKNVDGKMVSLDQVAKKGAIVIFTCNHCPYSVAYEDRIIALDKMYKSKGYPVVALNPNDPKREPGDSFEGMVQRAKEKGFTFPYLVDEKQEFAKMYGTTRTPHVFVLKKEGKELVVKYIGAIDNNTEDASKANDKFVEAALNDLLAGKDPQTNFTKAIGCTIKWAQ
jgi:peroxiredoxin